MEGLLATPVVQAGMGGGLSRHELAAAVSEAGGLGTIAVNGATAIARELAAGIARLARGIHVMPMGRYRTAAEVLQAIPRQGAADPRATA